MVWDGVSFPVKWVAWRERKRDYGFEDGWKNELEEEIGGWLGGWRGLGAGSWY